MLEVIKVYLGSHCIQFFKYGRKCNGFVICTLDQKIGDELLWGIYSASVQWN